MLDPGGCSVLFRVAAGPRIGFGHLVRCRSIARALGVTPTVSVRGSAATLRLAAAHGWATVGSAAAVVRESRASVVVVDDPSADHAAEWVRFARAAGVRVAALHDLGLGYVESDLGIDGSVLPRGVMRGRFGDLKGLAFAVLDPGVAALRAAGPPAEPNRVLVALGGGSDVCRLARGVVDAIAAASPAAEIRVAAGFTRAGRPALTRGEWIETPDGLANELARASVAVVGGGVTLYEACALGVPSVGLAVTDAQHATIAAFAERRATIDAGRPSYLATRSDAVARAVAFLLAHASERGARGAAARRLVDGRGVFRVADWLRRLPFLIEGEIDAA